VKSRQLTILAFSGLFNGARDAKVHLEAFIDLACPFSKKAFATLQALVKELGVGAYSFVTRRYMFMIH
jgi:protein-disulfide isomerase